MMSGHSANQIFFNKKNEDWTSRTLATPPSPLLFLRPTTSHFCLNPPPPKIGRHISITPKGKKAFSSKILMFIFWSTETER